MSGTYAQFGEDTFVDGLLSWPEFGVVVDCDGWNRQMFFDAVRSDIVVVHDSQDPWVVGFDRFAYRHTFGKGILTTLVSDTIDVRLCRL